jgi:hypothetical protein
MSPAVLRDQHVVCSDRATVSTLISGPYHVYATPRRGEHKTNNGYVFGLYTVTPRLGCLVL